MESPGNIISSSFLAIRSRYFVMSSSCQCFSLPKIAGLFLRRLLQLGYRLVSSSILRYLLKITSSIEEKSSGPDTVFILNACNLSYLAFPAGIPRRLPPDLCHNIWIIETFNMDRKEWHMKIILHLLEIFFRFVIQACAQSFSSSVQLVIYCISFSEFQELKFFTYFWYCIFDLCNWISGLNGTITSENHSNISAVFPLLQIPGETLFPLLT